MFDFFKRKQPLEKKESEAKKTMVYNLGQPIFTPRNYTQLADEGYNKNVIAYKAISMIARNAAYVDLQVFRGDTQLINHPLIDLLKKPNETQSGSEFFESLCSYQLIAGNTYVEMANSGGEINNQPPTYLYSLRPDRIKIIKGTAGLPAGYEYEAEGNKYNFPVSINGLSNIIHIKTFNPLSDWYGMSPIEAAAYSIDQHNEAAKWNQALLQNGARPSGALMVDENNNSGDLTDEQYVRLKDQIEKQYTGSRNAGRPLLLEGGLKWQEMSMNPRDMDFLNTKNTSARDIALAFGVPSQLLGIQGDSTYNNMAEARIALWENTIIPLLDKVLDSLNNHLSSRYGNDIKIVFDKDSIEALSPKRTQKAETLEKLSFLTDNEKRAAMGYESIAGGDELNKDNNNANSDNISKSAYIDSLINDGLEKKEAIKLANIVYADQY